jgi:hypothetical protein
MAVRDAVAQLVADVYAGKMNPRVASGLAPLLSLQLRVIETTDLEQRLVKVEKQLATPDKDVDSNKRDLDLDRNKPLISFAPENG